MVNSDFYLLIANICLIMSFVATETSAKICLIFLGVFNAILYWTLATFEIKILQKRVLLEELLLKRQKRK